MDIGNVCTPFFIDSCRLKVTVQDIFPASGKSFKVGMVVIFLYCNGAQTQPAHMPLDTFHTAWDTAVIEGAANLHCAIPTF